MSLDEYPLLLGTAKTDITPKVPVPLAGFAGRSGPFQQVKRRLYARMLVFRQQSGDGGEAKQAALVSADLLFWGSDRLPAIRRTLKDRWGFEADEIILHATHTHSGPQAAGGLHPALGTVDEKYIRRLEQALYEGIEQALGNMEPVTAERGLGACEFNIHRRVVVNGKAVTGPNENGPVDRDVNVIRFRNAEGRTKAILVHYTCHPTVSGENNVSSEFPGVAMERIEEELDDQAVSAYLQGCCGDVRPNLVLDGAFYRGGNREVHQLGLKLADEVLAVLHKPMQPLTGFRLQTGRTAFPLPLKERPGLEQLEKTRGQDDVIGKWSRLLLEHPERITSPVLFEMSMLRLSGQLAFLAMNGEVVVEYGLMLKRKTGGTVLPVPYSNGIVGYIPTARQVDEGGYEGRDSFVYFGLPAPFDRSLEERITGEMEKMMEQWGNRA